MIIMVDYDVATDLVALLRASGPHWEEVDRTHVADSRGIQLDGDEHVRDLLWRALDLLAFASVRIAARQGINYDQVVDEWEAVMAADARRAVSFPSDAKPEG